MAKELDLDETLVHHMTSQLRDGIEAKEPDVILTGKVECDEVYVVARP